MVNPNFKSALAESFSIAVDFSNSQCAITSPTGQIISNEWSDNDGLNICLIQWANSEFKENPIAQARLKSIKENERVSEGYVSIADYGYYHVIATGLDHVLHLFQGMGYKIKIDRNTTTKKINAINFNLKPS